MPDSPAQVPPGARWVERARVAVERRGLSPRKVTPLRIHDSAVLLVEGPEIIAKVTPLTPTNRLRAARAVRVTARLAATGYPCTRPIWPEPTVLDDAVVTFWEYYPQETRPSRESALIMADLLLELHHWDGSLPELPPARPLARITAAITEDHERRVPVLTAHERAYLQERIEAVRQGLGSVNSVLGRGLLHNDAHTGNLLRAPSTPHGYVLGDWDAVCRGPREMDLVLVGSLGHHYASTSTQRRDFCARYGFDLNAWPGCAVLTEARTLHALAAHLRTAPGKPGAAVELHARLDDLRGIGSHTWKAVR